MEFRPCIDIHNGKVKQIVGSTLVDGKTPETNFESNYPPSYYAKMYKEDNLRGGHVIKLGPDNHEAALEALSQWPGGLQIGGGITPDNARLYLDAGASHVIVTSYVFSNGQINFNNLETLVKVVGKERIVLDLSCKKIGNKYLIVTDRWQNVTDVELNIKSIDLFSKYSSELLVHGASVEGKMAGPDLDLVKLLSTSVLPITYAGGITTLRDLENVRIAGENRVHITVGSALDIFGGSLSYRKVVNFCK
jgi:phosphoribosylformimino-5-aminoimidazole carboxamide ribotide isomerase